MQSESNMAFVAISHRRKNLDPRDENFLGVDKNPKKIRFPGMKIPNPGDEYPRFKNPRNSSKISKNSDRQKRKNPEFFR